MHRWARHYIFIQKHLGLNLVIAGSWLSLVDKKGVNWMLTAGRSAVGNDHVVLVAVWAVLSGLWSGLFLFEIEVHSFGSCWGDNWSRRSGGNDVEIKVLCSIFAGDGLELLSHDIHRCRLLIFTLILLIFPETLHDIFMSDQIIQTRFWDRVSI